MENYIMFEGEKIALSEETTQSLKKALELACEDINMHIGFEAATSESYLEEAKED